MPLQVRETIPILRMFDVDKAKAFYVDFLGFTIDFEHRFSDDAPLYMQVSKGGCVLHLTEHHGDVTPGSAVILRVSGVEAFHAKLSEKQYPYARPGLEETMYGSKSVTVTDPFGNRLVFDEPINDESGVG